MHRKVPVQCHFFVLRCQEIFAEDSARKITCQRHALRSMTCTKAALPSDAFFPRENCGIRSEQSLLRSLQLSSNVPASYNMLPPRIRVTCPGKTSRSRRRSQQIGHYAVGRFRGVLGSNDNPSTTSPSARPMPIRLYHFNFHVVKKTSHETNHYQQKKVNEAIIHPRHGVHDMLPKTFPRRVQARLHLFPKFIRRAVGTGRW